MKLATFLRILPMKTKVIIPVSAHDHPNICVLSVRQLSGDRPALWAFFFVSMIILMIQSQKMTSS